MENRFKLLSWSWEFIFQVRKYKYEMAERLPCMGQSEEQEIRPWKLPPHELDSILCQNFFL